MTKNYKDMELEDVENMSSEEIMRILDEYGAKTADCWLPSEYLDAWYKYVDEDYHNGDIVEWGRKHVPDFNKLLLEDMQDDLYEDEE
ncbi:MAG: hypothetical protein QXU18_12270 [Thermoplasmatales archaeon]